MLLSPLDYASVNEWRSAVNHHIRDLLCADSAGFLLPGDDGTTLYSDEHDQKALATFPEVEPPRLPDGRSIWDESVRAEVTTVKRAYGRAYELYSRSAYYNEYAAVNGAYDTIGATIAIPGMGAGALASLHFWHGRPVGRTFGERELALLRILFPAFQAGVESQVRWDHLRRDLLHGLDALGQAVIVFDLAGRMLHQTPALTALLARDPEASLLNGELRVTMNAVRGGGVTATFTDVSPCVREVRTANSRYAIRACVYGGPPCGCRPYLLVSLERLSPTRRTEVELRETFGLTRAEMRLAACLAEGKTNATIARELYVTEHTARRHTEHILQKMGIHSRAQIVAWMYV